MTYPPPGAPRGLCSADLLRYGEDVEVDELEHEECRVAARQHDDQLLAYGKFRSGLDS